MDRKSTLSVWVYNNELERELWKEKHDMDVEIENEMDIIDLSENILNYGPGIEELLGNTVEHVKKQTQFPSELDFSQNLYCKALIEEMAETILDDYVSEEMYKAIRKIILTRAANAAY